MAENKVEPCHPERSRASAASEDESKDPDNVSSAMLLQGVLTTMHGAAHFSALLTLNIPENYRFAWTLANFFTFGFLLPRG